MSFRLDYFWFNSDYQSAKGVSLSGETAVISDNEMGCCSTEGTEKEEDGNQLLYISGRKDPSLSI